MCHVIIIYVMNKIKPRNVRRKLYKDMKAFRDKHPDYTYAELAGAFIKRGVNSAAAAFQILNTSQWARRDNGRQGNGGHKTH